MRPQWYLLTITLFKTFLSRKIYFREWISEEFKMHTGFCVFTCHCKNWSHEKNSGVFSYIFFSLFQPARGTKNVVLISIWNQKFDFKLKSEFQWQLCHYPPYNPVVRKCSAKRSERKIFGTWHRLCSPTRWTAARSGSGSARRARSSA